MTIDAADFPAFYAEVYRVDPFPWQVDLARRVLAERSWPELIDVPTGMGKTAMIDIAVFVAAVTSEEAGDGRLGRRRVFFVVDRRIVVDEAHDRAQRLAKALDAALLAGGDTAAHRVALGLRALAPSAGNPLLVPTPGALRPSPRTVLPVTRMRGGVTWDAAWLDRPDIPGVVVGTIDQIGSRLLFRGYGVSDRRKPIDAALVGSDSLVLVDEAHLAEAMVTTLAEAQRRDRSGLGVPPAAVVQLTATPTSTARRAYVMDVEAHRRHEVAWRRLNAAKRMRFEASDPKRIVEALADQALRCIDAEPETVLVVCNTVNRARQVHAALEKATRRRRDPVVAAAFLLTGRSRPADRDILVGQLLDRFGVGRVRGGERRPAILVSTQTVEVGANLDFDALVSESAPWDSLVQRLGRLNRLGDFTGVAPATVIHDDADNLVYGAARTVAWEFLGGLVDSSDAGIDVSPLACRALAGEAPADAFAERPAAPLLLGPTLDAWTRTAPVPLPDAPVAPFLHGLGRHPATVAVAWRDGLVDADPAGDDAERPDDDVHADLSALPVLPAELVELPLHAARRWLRGEASLPLSDLDSEDVTTPPRTRAIREPFRAVAWRAERGTPLHVSPGVSPSGGSWVWIEADALRPGDVLVVPAERGGLDDFGWDPDSLRAVLDVAEVVRFGPDGSGARRRRLRVDAGSGRRLGLRPEDAMGLRRRLRSLSSGDGEEDDGSEEMTIGAWLSGALLRVLDEHRGWPAGQRLPGVAWAPDGLSSLRAWVDADADLTAVSGPLADSGAEMAAVNWRRGGDDRFVLVPRRTDPSALERDDELVECSSIGIRQVSLRAHHANVGGRARDIALAIGLAPQLVDAVDAAARWHDLGKAETRFQTMLCGGDRFETMLLDEPLAKSGLDPTDRSGYRRARIRSALPAGVRHEAWSAAAVGQYLATGGGTSEIDRELVIHLVASHHGHARPWLPPVHDDDPSDLVIVVEGGPPGAPDMKVSIRTDDTVDFEHPARFARLNERYGRWGLALLETIVRCADMTVSEEGS